MTPLENAQYVLSQDQFSQWMGVSLIEIKENYCLIKMPIREEMINGLKTVHGGVTFSFAESALAFSSLNYGEAAVALNCTINFTQAVKLGFHVRNYSHSLFIEYHTKLVKHNLNIRDLFANIVCVILSQIMQQSDR